MAKKSFLEKMIVSAFKKKQTKYGNIKPAKTKQEAHDINVSFRTNESYERQQLDFVRGIEIKPSNNPENNCKVCHALKGKYPKSFEWYGWFNNCTCYTTSVLVDDDTFIHWVNKVGTSSEYALKNEINDYPINFKLLGGFGRNDKLTEKQAMEAYGKIFDIGNMVYDIENRIRILNKTVNSISKTKNITTLLNKLEEIKEHLSFIDNFDTKLPFRWDIEFRKSFDEISNNINQNILRVIKCIEVTDGTRKSTIERHIENIDKATDFLTGNKEVLPEITTIKNNLK